MGDDIAFLKLCQQLRNGSCREVLWFDKFNKPRIARHNGLDKQGTILLHQDGAVTIEKNLDCNCEIFEEDSPMKKEVQTFNTCSVQWGELRIPYGCEDLMDEICNSTVVDYRKPEFTIQTKNQAGIDENKIFNLIENDLQQVKVLEKPASLVNDVVNMGYYMRRLFRERSRNQMPESLQININHPKTLRHIETLFPDLIEEDFVPIVKPKAIDAKFIVGENGLIEDLYIGGRSVVGTHYCRHKRNYISFRLQPIQNRYENAFIKWLTYTTEKRKETRYIANYVLKQLVYYCGNKKVKMKTLKTIAMENITIL